MINVVLFHQLTAPLATGLGLEVSQDQRHWVQRSHTLHVPCPQERRLLPASLSLWKMTALSVHNTKQDDSESPATRLSFPCVHYRALDVGMLADGGGWEEMWVPSHAPTLLPSCLSPAPAEPIPALCCYPCSSTWDISVSPSLMLRDLEETGMYQGHWDLRGQQAGCSENPADLWVITQDF